MGNDNWDLWSLRGWALPPPNKYQKKEARKNKVRCLVSNDVRLFHHIAAMLTP